MQKNKALVFLDFDGVLNDASRSYVGNINRDAVARLNRLVTKGDADVVVSSSWRLTYPLDVLRGMLKSNGFTGRVIDVTPKDLEFLIDGESTTRGHEILAWLETAGLIQRDGSVTTCLCPVVILDDAEPMGPLDHFLIRTHPCDGLTNENVDGALRQLSRPTFVVAVK